MLLRLSVRDKDIWEHVHLLLLAHLTYRDGRALPPLVAAAGLIALIVPRRSTIPPIQGGRRGTEDAREGEARRVPPTHTGRLRARTPATPGLLLSAVLTQHWKKEEKDWSTDAFDATTRLLQVNPELYTIWNYRRRILLHGIFPSWYDLEPGCSSVC
jgi:hypothetical protein